MGFGIRPSSKPSGTSHLPEKNAYPNDYLMEQGCTIKGVQQGQYWVISLFNYLITILQLTSGYRFTTEDNLLTPRTSIQFHSHGNMCLPAPWNKPDKSSIERWIERSSLNSISIIVAWERLQRSKSRCHVLNYLINIIVNGLNPGLSVVRLV